MKTVYIPKGEIVRYESLMTEHLVVHGCLQVSNGIKARTITGQGTISAGTIDADVIRVDDVEAGSIVCKRLLAKRVQSPEVFASESAAVTCRRGLPLPAASRTLRQRSAMALRSSSVSVGRPIMK